MDQEEAADSAEADSAAEVSVAADIAAAASEEAREALDEVQEDLITDSDGITDRIITAAEDVLADFSARLWRRSL